MNTRTTLTLPVAGVIAIAALLVGVYIGYFTLSPSCPELIAGGEERATEVAVKGQRDLLLNDTRVLDKGAKAIREGDDRDEPINEMSVIRNFTRAAGKLHDD